MPMSTVGVKMPPLPPTKTLLSMGVFVNLYDGIDQVISNMSAITLLRLPICSLASNLESKNCFGSRRISRPKKAVEISSQVIQSDLLQVI